MDLRFSAEQEALRSELVTWLKDQLPRPWDEELRDPKNDADGLFELRCSWQAKLNAAGYLGMDWPREWGGRGATPVEKAIFAAESIRHGAPPIPNNLGISLLGPGLIHHGTEEQRRRFLPKMLTAEEIWCQGFSEPDAGSDLAALRTKAEPDGQDFRLTGQKVWTTLGTHADWIFALARTEAGNRYGGITLFLVPLRQEGVEVRPIRQISGESEFGEVFFDAALARREHIVGGIGEGWRIAMTILGYERGSATLTHAARFDQQLKHLVQGLREKGTLNRQDVREKLGRLWVENEVMRANSYRTLATLAEGNQPGPQSSFEKLYWTEYSQRFSDTALDLLGLQAQLICQSPYARTDMDWAYNALWCRAGTIYAGSSEIQRNIIATRILELPRG